MDCSTKGTEVLRAKPKAGYFRLRNQTKAVQCLEPKERCTPETLKHKGVESVKSVFLWHRDASHQLTCMSHTNDRTDRGSKDSARATCQSNYSGTMCMDCAETFYASGKGCEKCVDAEIPHAVLLLLGATW